MPAYRELDAAADLSVGPYGSPSGVSCRRDGRDEVKRGALAGTELEAEFTRAPFSRERRDVRDDEKALAAVEQVGRRAADSMGLEAFRRRVKIYTTDVDKEALSEVRQGRRVARRSSGPVPGATAWRGRRDPPARAGTAS